MSSTILRNPKHELYAQGVVSGLSRADAYIKAGYKAKNPMVSASVLERRHPPIQRRIDELLNNGAKRVELTRRDILERVLQDWDTSRQLGQMASALKAGDMLGRELFKMFTERKEIGGPGDFDSKSEEELRAIITDGLKDLGWDEKDTPPPASALN